MPRPVSTSRPAQAPSGAAHSIGQTFDVVVVGAGIVGCAVAYAFSRTGASVALIEKGDVGGAVSGASLACVGTHMLSRDELPLLIHACDLWRGLTDELGRDFEYSACGQLRFVRREEDLAVARSWIDLERSHGAASELLDPGAVRSIVPALTGSIVAATWSPNDATVNPFLACRVLVEGAVERGCRLFTGTAVEAVYTERGRVTGVQAGPHRIATGCVVNAAGPWAARVAALAGVRIPIAPRKAQCLATVALPPTIPCVVGACESAGGVEAGYTQIQQSAHGQVLFNTVLGGGVRSEGGQDTDLGVDHRFIVESVETLLWLFPSLGEVELLRSWARYEAVTPDDHFLIGPMPGVDGFLLAAGDGGTGFNRALVIGEMLAQWVVDGRSAFALTPYLVERFAGPGMREAKSLQ